MRHKLAALLLGIVCCSQTLSALIVKDIDTTQALDCEFSPSNQNRILVKDGFVRKVICPEGYFLIELDPVSGQAFVFPMVRFRETVTLSVVTGKGNVQDLFVKLVDGPSETVILYEQDDVFFSSSKKENRREENKAGGIASVVKSMLLGNLPVGYSPSKEKEALVRDCRVKEANLVFSQAIESVQYVVYEYHLINQSSEPVIISEEDVWSPLDQWIYLGVRELASGESTVVYVGVSSD